MADLLNRRGDSVAGDVYLSRYQEYPYCIEGIVRSLSGSRTSHLSPSPTWKIVSECGRFRLSYASNFCYVRRPNLDAKTERTFVSFLRISSHHRTAMRTNLNADSINADPFFFAKLTRHLQYRICHISTMGHLMNKRVVLHLSFPVFGVLHRHVDQVVVFVVASAVCPLYFVAQRSLVVVDRYDSHVGNRSYVLER